MSVRPNSSARGAGILPAATGRLAVRLPIRRSMSRSMTWFRALAPPQASANPTTSAVVVPTGGRPRAPATIPQMPVSSSRLMIRGFVSVR
jgi:hypothetical protein